MKIKHILLLMIFLLCVNLVAAFNLTGSPNWLQEANAGSRTAGGQGYLSYCTNQRNNIALVNITYDKCVLPSSSFTPVAADFFRDNVSYYAVVVGSAQNQIRFYSKECAVAGTITLNGTINSNPVVRDLWNSDDGYPELYFIENDTFTAWEFDGTELTRLFKFNFTSYAPAANLHMNYLGCGDDRNYDLCIGAIPNTDDIYLFNMSNGSLHDFQAADLSGNIWNYKIRNGVSTVEDATGESFTVFCNVHDSISTTTKINCDWYRQNGQRYYLRTLTASTSGNVVGINYSSANLVRMGSSYIYLAHLMATKTGSIYSSKAYDDSGSEIYSSIAGSSDTLNQTSNWFYGAFDKTNNLACHLINISQNNDVTLQCFDSSFSSPFLEFNATNIINITQGIVMGDFFSNESYLGIADISGVYYWDGSTFVRVVETGIKSGEDRIGQSIIVSESASGSPVYLYTDDNNGFIIANLQSTSGCGDGFCSSIENCFSCSIDCCESELEVDCVADSDCPSVYPNCLSSKCVRGFNATLTCIDATDCPATSPICWSGYCLEGISGGTPTTETTNQTVGQQEIDDSITNTIGLLTGTSPLLKFIIALMIIIGMIFAAVQATNNAFVITIVAVLGFILTTVLNLMPVFILVLFIIIAVIMLIFAKFILNSSEG